LAMATAVANSCPDAPVLSMATDELACSVRVHGPDQPSPTRDV